MAAFAIGRKGAKIEKLERKAKTKTEKETSGGRLAKGKYHHSFIKKRRNMTPYCRGTVSRHAVPRAVLPFPGSSAVPPCCCVAAVFQQQKVIGLCFSTEAWRDGSGCKNGHCCSTRHHQYSTITYHTPGKGLKYGEIVSRDLNLENIDFCCCRLHVHCVTIPRQQQQKTQCIV